MSKLLPQEFEVWYLIPAIRREISRILLEDHKYKQKQVAQLLQVTEGAISQYKASKRAQELSFNEQELTIITEKVAKILEHPEQTNRCIYELCKELMGTRSVCALHKKLDTSLPLQCDICSECSH